MFHIGVLLAVSEHMDSSVAHSLLLMQMLLLWNLWPFSVHPRGSSLLPLTP